MGSDHSFSELLESQLCDLFERLEDADPVDCLRLVERIGVVGVEVGIEFVDREGVFEVPFVVLEDHGQIFDFETQFDEIVDQALEALDIRLTHGSLGIGDKDQAVHTLQNEFSCGVVENLSGDGVELESRLESTDRAHLDGEQIEEQSTVGLGLERHHFAARIRIRLGVDVAQIRRLAAQTRTVIYDLGGHLHRCPIKENHYV